jgi:hypothetical protein
MLALSRGNEISRLAQGSPLSEVPRLARAFLVENGYLEFTSSSPEVRPWVAASLPDLIRSSRGFIQVEKELSAALREALPHQVESVANLARQAGANNVIGVLAKLGDLQTLPEHTAVQVTRLAAEARPAAFTILERALGDTRASVRTAAVQVVQGMRLNADSLDSLLKRTVCHHSNHSNSAGTQAAGISIARYFAAQNQADVRPTLESFAPNICRFAQAPGDVAFGVSILRTGGRSGVQIADMLGKTIERVRTRAPGELEQTQSVRLRAILGELRLLGPEANHVYKLVRDLGRIHPHLRNEISQTLAAISPARARLGVLAEVYIQTVKMVRESFFGSAAASTHPVRVEHTASKPSMRREEIPLGAVDKSEVLRFAAERLMYADVGGDETPSDRALEISESYIRYAQTQVSSNAQLEEVTQAGIASVLLALRRLGVPPSPFCQSQSWYAWDVAKQLYYLEQPTSSSAAYRLANPFTDALKREEIVDRHLGWELAAAQRDDGLPESFWLSFQHSEQRLIRQILEKFPDRESPPSNELARLGRIVNDALARHSS